MSVSGISSNSSIYQSQMLQMRKDFSSLQSSLSSGSLASAQQAYATLIQDMQNAQQSQNGVQTGASGSTNLAAVGAALQSGNLTTAQNAFNTLVQDIQGLQQARGTQQSYQGYGYHHHHHGGTSQTTFTSFSTDLAAVGAALQSGDVASAQKAFNALLQDLGNSGDQNSAGSTGNGLFQAPGSIVNVII